MKLIVALIVNRVIAIAYCEPRLPDGEHEQNNMANNTLTYWFFQLYVVSQCFDIVIRCLTSFGM